MHLSTSSPTTSSQHGLKNSTSRNGCALTPRRPVTSAASAALTGKGVTSSPDGRVSVLVLGGQGGCDFDQATVKRTANQSPEIDWKTLGLRGGPRTVDPWPDICAADVVVTHAGQNCVADVATARRPAIVIPQVRPFNEQYVTADTLTRHGLALATSGWPDADSLAILDRAGPSLRLGQMATVAHRRGRRARCRSY